VTAKDLKQAWDRVLEPALKEFIELTELKEGVEKDWGKGSRIDKFNTKVLKAIRKLDTGKRGSLGPTMKEIAEEAGVERYVAAETLARMKDSGVLYEPRPGHYRLV
jgi:DNA replicative helicase MCM subunit Mcm2 (Cdc46/Mcm family)